MIPTVLLSLLLAASLSSCGDGTVGTIIDKGGASDNDPGKTPGDSAPTSTLSSCKGWKGANLCLVTQGEGTGTTTTPTLTFEGPNNIGGIIRLYRDSACSNLLGSPTVASLPTTRVTPPAQTTFTAKYYAQYTHTDGTQSPCLGPVVWRVEEKPSIAILSAVYSKLTFTISDLTLTGGRILLYSDPTCNTPASGRVSVNAPSHPIIANPLTRYGSFDFYVRHTDSTNDQGDCTGPVNYNFASGLQNNAPHFSLHPVNTPSDDDPTPTFRLTNLDFERGKIQLFRNAGCYNAVSAVSIYSYPSAGTAISANPLSTWGNYQYWAKITENIENQSRCVGPVSYEYIPTVQTESLILSLSDNPLDSNPTPTLNIAGLIAHNGTVQLFSDATCATSASTAVNVTGATASITANALTTGTHQFYVRHTDSGGNTGDCAGSVTYSLETLSLALSSSNTPLDSDPTPTLEVSGLVVHNGTVQLFSDSTCTTASSTTVSVTGATASITANALTAGTHQFYAQHTDSGSNKGDCVGPVAYSMETLSLALSSSNTPLDSDSTPTLEVSGLVVHNGTVQLFSESTCTTASSTTVSVTGATASITANALTAGTHQFYAQHTDSGSNKGDCVGPVAYSMETLSLAISSPSAGWGADDTPTLEVSGLVVHNGAVQLFSNSTCTTASSTAVNVTGATASITANALTAGTHQFYAQHTDSGGNKGDCTGPVAYSLETLSLALSSSNTPLDSDPTPTLEVSGLVVHNGTVQLFSNSTCTTASSTAVNVTGATASITANTLTAGTHQFYAQHTDSGGNKGDCIGPAPYTLETLALALSSSNTPLDSDSTPTLEVTGLVAHNGTVQLFSDATCSTATSGTETVTGAAASITANALTAGTHQFYVRHTDSDGNSGNCTGPVAYSLETLSLALSSPSTEWGSDDTPTLEVSGLTIHNGTAQLFSDATCTTAASASVNVTGATASITANALAPGTHQFYVRHTDSGGNSGDCTGPVTYALETLSLAMSSPSTGWGSDNTPTLEVSGLVVHNGTVQLFSDSTCTTAASTTVNVTGATASITANTLALGTHQFYVQHTDSDGNNGDCTGPIAYRYTTGTLTLSLSSPSTGLGSDDTPTFSVGGLVIHNGTVQLFSDATCATSASTTVSVTGATASITANALTAGTHQFYAQHTDSGGSKGDCVGPVTYSMETLSLAISSPSAGWGADDTPTLEVSGLVVHNGAVQLFSNSTCTTASSTTVSVTGATASITANALTAGTHQFYAQHTDSGGNKGDCVGPVAYSMETLSLALSSSNTPLDSDSTPTLEVSGLVVHNGTVQLFSDSTCTTAASTTVNVTGATASITANALTAGTHQFYAQHTDSGGNKGDCVGPVAYSMETLSLAISSPSAGWGADDTPTLEVSGLVVHNGAVQLFSNSTCTTAASTAVNVTGATASITANTLTAGTHQFYAQHTDSGGNKGDCVGPVAYSMETLSLAISSPSAGWGADDTPTLEVSGLVVHNGTLQLFSNSTCTTASSTAVNVTGATASITANTLTAGTHQFYAQHTDSGGSKGDCVGPVAYSLETLSLALSSSNTPFDSDSTPTLEVDGLVVLEGTVQLFSESTCATAASATVNVTAATASITASALTEGTHQFYTQHTDSGGNPGDCIGPVAYRYSTEALTLTLTSPSIGWGFDDTPTFEVSGLMVLNGTIQLFSESTCTTSASATVNVTAATASITTRSLTVGSYNIYVRHTDSDGNEGNCVGPTPYSMEILRLALSSSNTAFDSDPTPTLEVTGLVVHNGTVQLFSDAFCATAASAAVNVTGATASITANTLTVGMYNFYVRHTDSDGNPGDCAGLVQYRYSTEMLTLTRSSPSSARGFDDTPTFSVTGLEVLSGTVQLFSDSTCSTSVSSPITVTAATATITANTLTLGEHNFYVQHTDTANNQGNCVGPTAYEYTEEDFKPVSAGGYSSCVILSDGALKCWGKNNNGQLGDGSTADRDTPTAINLGSGRTAKAVSVGYAHTCAILDDDSLKCWGSYANGRLGLGGTITSDQQTPAAVDLGAGRTAKAIAAGHSHTCAILDDDNLKCWGANNNSQIGDGSTTERNTPHPVALGGTATAKAVDVGNNHTCAILDGDSLRCWGFNGSGRLGDGTDTSRNTPTTIDLGTGRTAKAISLGSNFTCAILDDDSLKCWGSNTDGRLGIGGGSAQYSPTAVALGTGRTASAVSLGTSHACAILDDGSLKCWGNNGSGQVGDGTSTGRNAPTAITLGTGRTAAAVDLGFNHSCALLDDDSLKCWGADGSGQLGDGGTNTSQDEPTEVDYD